MVGSRLVAEAIARGHRVAAARHPDRDPTNDAITPSMVDVEDASTLLTAMTGADAAVSAIRPAAGCEDLLAPRTAAILDAAQTAGVRMLIIAGAGPLQSPGRPDLLVAHNPDYVPHQRRVPAAASTQQLRTCAPAHLRTCEAHANTNWAYLSPPAVLEPGVRTGTYRLGHTTLLIDPNGASRISVEDLAVATIDLVENPATRGRFAVAAAASTRTDARTREPAPSREAHPPQAR